MIVIRGRVLRIFPDEEQIEKIEQNFGACRFVYNRFLNRYLKSDEKFSLYKADKELTQLKRDLGYDWLITADAVALQEALKNLQTAFQRYENGISGKPKCKCKSTPVQSYRTRNNNSNIKFFTDNIKIPKIGRINCTGYNSISGKILNATIKRAYNKYYCILCVKESINNDDISDAYTSRIALEKYKLPEEIQHRRDILNCDNDEVSIKRTAHYNNAINDWLQKLSTEICQGNRFINIENYDDIESNLPQEKILTKAEYNRLARMIEYKAPIYKCDIIQGKICS